MLLPKRREKGWSSIILALKGIQGQIPIRIWWHGSWCGRWRTTLWRLLLETEICRGIKQVGAVFYHCSEYSHQNDCHRLNQLGRMWRRIQSNETYHQCCIPLPMVQHWLVAHAVQCQHGWARRSSCAIVCRIWHRLQYLMVRGLWGDDCWSNDFQCVVPFRWWGHFDR